MEHQFDQMKEEMVAKEAAVQKEKSEKNDLENSKEDLGKQLEKANTQCHEKILLKCHPSSDYSPQAKASDQKLKETAASIEMELNRANGEVKNLKSKLEKSLAKLNSDVREREGLNEKLRKCEESVRDCEAKITLLDKTLARGDVAYKEREDDIKVSLTKG